MALRPGAIKRGPKCLDVPSQAGHRARPGEKKPQAMAAVGVVGWEPSTPAGVA
jgi:hypothetical protein